MTEKLRISPLEEGRIIPISFNYHFVRIFGDKDNMDIIEFFISDYYNLPIQEVTGNIEILSRDLKQDSKGEKSKQVDLLLKLKDKKINIEISNTTSFGRKERDLVYLSKIHGGQLRYKSDYKSIGSSWQIRLNDAPCNNGKIRKIYYLIDKDNINDIYSDKFRIDNVDLVEASKIEYNEGKGRLVRWCRILRARTREEIVNELGDDLMDKKTREKLLEEVERNSRNEEIIDIYEKYSTFEMERDDILQDALENNTKKVTEDVTKKVTEDVTRKNQIETAKKMINDNLDIKIISKYTGLSKEEIKMIK